MGDQVEDALPKNMESHGASGVRAFAREAVEVGEDKEIFGRLEPLDLSPLYNAWILEDCNMKLPS